MESLIADISRNLFGLICHQDPSLLMSVDGELIWLCPRCSGLHFGFLVSFVAIILLPTKRLDLREWGTTILLSVAVVFFFVDWGSGQIGLYEPTILSRMLTGLAMGSVVGILFSEYRRTLKDAQLPGERLMIVRSAAILSCTIIAGVLLLYSGNLRLITVVLLITVLINFLLILQTSYRIIRKLKFSGFERHS